MKKHVKKAEDYASFIPILKAEIAILERIALCQERVKKAVQAREWTDFDKIIAELNKLSEEFEILETKRVEAFSNFSGRGDDEEGSFYNIVVKMPWDLQEDFKDLYRQLKLYVLRVRLANDSLTHYIVEARATVTEFLGEAFPDRKGRLYSRRGTQTPVDMRSMVLDRVL